MTRSWILMAIILGSDITGCQVSHRDSVGSASSPAVIQSVCKKVFGGGEFTEGPAIGADGRVYFSDLTFDSVMIHGRIWCYDPRSDATILYRSPSNMSNGIKFDGKGRMVVAEGDDRGVRRISRTDSIKGTVETLADSYRGTPFNSPNDLAIDRHGRIYFTDPRYGNLESVTQDVKGVYRLDPDGNVTRLLDSIAMPNGIALAPDERTLYIGSFDEEQADHGKSKALQMALFAYDLLESGLVGNGRVLVDFGTQAGPDGLAVDEKGNILAAIRNEQHPGIYVFDPSGVCKGVIPVPAVPSNLVFDRTTGRHLLYVTAGGGLYRVNLRDSN